MTTQRVAVDSTAKEFWESYFGDYGKQWVRDIPRNIRAAMLPHIRQAANGKAPPELSAYEVAPFGYAVTADRLQLDGVFRGTYADGTKTARLFRADFNHDGDLIDLTVREARA